MHADLVGALEQLEKSWRAFEHKGNPMTKEQVRKALVYGIKKGYEHTGQLTDEDVDNALSENQEKSIYFSYKCARCGSVYSNYKKPLDYSNCVVEKPITHEKCNGDLVLFSNNFIK